MENRKVNLPMGMMKSVWGPALGQLSLRDGVKRGHHRPELDGE